MDTRTWSWEGANDYPQPTVCQTEDDRGSAGGQLCLLDFLTLCGRWDKGRVCLSTLKLSHETRLRGENGIRTVLDDAKGPADHQSSWLG